MTTWRWYNNIKTDGIALMLKAAVETYIARYHITPTVARLNKAQFADALKQYGVIHVILDKDVPPNTVDLEHCDPNVFIQPPTIHSLPLAMVATQAQSAPQLELQSALADTTLQS